MRDFLKTYLDYVRKSPAHREEMLSVQWLRGLAVLMVMVYHVEDIIRTLPGLEHVRSFWMDVGYSAPDLFFVISGYIMCYVTFSMPFERTRWLISRIIRIYPMYILFTFVAFCVWMIEPSMTMGSGVQTPVKIVKAFLIFPQKDLPLVFVGWTVEHEVVFYAIVFCVAALGGKLRTLTTVLGILSALASLRWLLKSSIPGLEFWDYHFLSLFMVQFYIGALVFEHGKRLRALGAAFPVIAGILLFSSGAWLPAPGAVDDETLPRILLYGTAFGLLLLGGVNRELQRRDKGLQPPSKRPFMVRVGDASYSMYLLHPFVLSTGGKILKVLHLGGLPGGFGAIFVGLVALFGGLAFYALIEKPATIFLRKRFLPTKRPPPQEHMDPLPKSP